MREINPQERRMVMQSGNSRKSIVISHNLFEISNGVPKAVINPDNGRHRGFNTNGDAMEWIADFGDGNKSYFIQECCQHAEEYAKAAGID